MRMRIMRPELVCVIFFITRVINGASVPEKGNEPFRMWMSEEALNWTEAVEACRRRGGQLLHDDATLGVQISKTIDQLVTNEEIWLGARVLSTPWVWENNNASLYTYLGYSPEDAVEVVRHLVVHDNQVFTCSALCSTSYVALKGTFCGCLQNKPSEIRKETSRLAVCPGNIEESCGNATGYDIYSDGLIAHFGTTLRKFRIGGNNAYDFTFAYLSVVQNYSTIATSNSRSYKKGVLCDQDDPQDHRFTNFTRDEALEACGGQGLYTVRTDRVLPSPLPGEYWIGLKRSYTWRWINGDAVDVTHLPVRDNRGQCLGLRKTEDKTSPHDFKCGDKKKYICIARRSTAPGVSPTPERDTPLYWRIWLAVGVGVGVAMIVLLAAICILLRRQRRSRDDKKDTTQHRELEVEYSSVQDTMIGGVLSLPDVVTDEGVYSEPCAEDGTSNTPKSVRGKQTFQESHYDFSTIDKQEYVTPDQEPTYSETVNTSGYSSPHLKRTATDVVAERNGSPKAATKWELGRYDVPRNMDDSKAPDSSGVVVVILQNDEKKEQSDSSSTYDVPASKDNIYAKPMK